MITAAAGTLALTSLRSLYDISKDIRNSSDPEKLKIAAGQMFELAIAAREQVAALQEERNAAVTELTALKAEIEKADRFDEKAEAYTRERNGSGAVIYREKDAGGPQGQSPYFCPNCFGNKKLSMLNPAKGANTRLGVYDFACGACGNVMPLQAVW
jgi:hypothetical protein